MGDDDINRAVRSPAAHIVGGGGSVALQVIYKQLLCKTVFC